MKGRRLFEMTKKLMIISGMWRSKLMEGSHLTKTLYLAYSILVQFLYATHLLSYIINFYLLYSENFDDTIENISKMLYVMLILVKVILCQSRGLMELVEIAGSEEVSLENSGDVSMRMIYGYHRKQFYKIMYTIVSYTVTLFFKLSILGIQNSYRSNKLYKHVNETVGKPLPLSMWFPFDENRYHYLALTYQVVQLFWTALFTVTVYAVSNSLAIFLRAKLKIFQHQLRNLNSNPPDDENELKMLCLEHKAIISWSGRLNSSFSWLILLEYSLTSLMLATVLVQIHEGNDEIFHMVYFFLIFCQLLNICWNANEIKCESLELAGALYESRWYDLNQRVKNLLKFMMLKCQSPLGVNVGPFGILTTDDANSRLKLAYSFLSIMTGRS
ncbi:odorant receptor 30a-like [Cylas formicarius]|uniref:odorant receptor 30a-like n=1 Tax=Cylas formicarius TaxID=197179 RepID=UPI0029586A0A|nr:odorant receptor 30a-like [Cylas formicarius]